MFSGLSPCYGNRVDTDSASLYGLVGLVASHIRRASRWKEVVAAIGSLVHVFNRFLGSFRRWSFFCRGLGGRGSGEIRRLSRAVLSYPQSLELGERALESPVKGGLIEKKPVLRII